MTQTKSSPTRINHWKTCLALRVAQFTPDGEERRVTLTGHKPCIRVTRQAVITRNMELP
ncbi:hypothetical protein DPMN_027820 [Dreissena polymorpha]|uniref:Uncharacterized protein n=1 Tax=Dreissena polymorpha TaxID=45954 RepID=A0A9D4RDZ9_DREPO|nr:hypothetical protein DPMN_027820 [Dreissena polymorpha]